DPWCGHGRTVVVGHSHHEGRVLGPARGAQQYPSRRGTPMTAPSLILLGSAGADPRVAGVSQELRAMLTTARPEVDVAVAFLDQGYPRCLQVAGKLAKRGVTEVVVVPLHVADAHPRQPETAALIAQIRTAHPSLRVIAAAPVGPEAQLLSVVDQRLRDALRARRVDQLDGLVLSTEAATDVRSNALL